ncbi:hypothetical protein RintRC_4665 [Richelia intracellularis]|nr:hypothetical protein RintRC_4665 [Richelia intracellularis]
MRYAIAHTSELISVLIDNVFFANSGGEIIIPVFKYRCTHSKNSSRERGGQVTV